MSEERHKEIVKKLEDKYLGKYLILKDGTTTDEIISVSVDYNINKQDMNRLSDGSKKMFINEILCTTDDVKDLIEQNKLLELKLDLYIGTLKSENEAIHRANDLEEELKKVKNENEDLKKQLTIKNFIYNDKFENITKDLFDKLGYKLVFYQIEPFKHDSYQFVYEQKDRDDYLPIERIEFSKQKKHKEIFISFTEYDSRIYPSVLKAMYEQCKELKWFDEK